VQARISASSLDSGYTRIPPRAGWDLDANAAYVHYTPNETIHGVEFQEIPEVGEIPLVADESVNDPSEAADARVEGACAAVTVKLSKIGSLDAALGGHLPTYLSSALDGPVGIAAAAHVAQTLDPNLPWPEVAHGLATERRFAETIAFGGALTDGPRLDPPSDGPGIGVELDETALTRCRLG